MFEATGEASLAAAPPERELQQRQEDEHEHEVHARAMRARVLYPPEMARIPGGREGGE